MFAGLPLPSCDFLRADGADVRHQENALLYAGGLQEEIRE
jgi:hypothetical protein